MRAVDYMPQHRQKKRGRGRERREKRSTILLSARYFELRAYARCVRVASEGRVMVAESTFLGRAEKKKKTGGKQLKPLFELN